MPTGACTTAAARSYTLRCARELGKSAPPPLMWPRTGAVHSDMLLDGIRDPDSELWTNIAAEHRHHARPPQHRWHCC